MPGPFTRSSIRLLLCIGFTMALQADPISVSIYTGFEDTGGGAPFSGLVGTFGSEDIQFGTDTGFEWAPYNLSLFGADLTGELDAATNSVYRISLVSDDGSELFIDGSLAINDGGLHGPGLEFTDIALTEGLHPFEIQYFQGSCCQAGLDMNLATGLTYASAPEPGSNVLLFAGFVLTSLLAATRRRR